nr:hypothetical protein [candidate division Zixibacteria bacterium]
MKNVFVSFMFLIWLTALPALSEGIYARFDLDNTGANDRDGRRHLTALFGDSATGETMPNLKLEVWNGEGAFCLDLKRDPGITIQSIDRDTANDAPVIDCRMSDSTVHSVFLSPNGDLEWLIKLKTPPDTEVLSFDMISSGLCFFYQDSTQFSDDIMCRGPDWVQGSYAVYHRSGRNNITVTDDDENHTRYYETGKAFHIRRPLAFDAHGDSAWCDLAVDTINNRFDIALPSDFMAAAVYPVTIDPTFGKSSMGVWDLTIVDYRHIVLWNIGCLETGEGEITGGYVGCDVSGELEGTLQVRVHSYTRGDDLDESKYHASSSVTDVTDTAAIWVECPMSGALDSGVTYMVSMQGYNSINGKLCIKADVTSWGDIKYSDLGDWTAPDSLTGYSNKNDGYSAYVEFTAATADMPPGRRRRIIQSEWTGLYGNGNFPSQYDSFTIRGRTREEKL